MSELPERQSPPRALHSTVFRVFCLFTELLKRNPLRTDNFIHTLEEEPEAQRGPMHDCGPVSPPLGGKPLQVSRGAWRPEELPHPGLVLWLLNPPQSGFPETPQEQQLGTPCSLHSPSGPCLDVHSASRASSLVCAQPAGLGSGSHLSPLALCAPRPPGLEEGGGKGQCWSGAAAWERPLGWPYPEALSSLP